MAETTVASGKAVIRPELQNGFANKIRSDLNKESGGIASTFGSLGKNIGATFAAGFAAVGTAAILRISRGMVRFVLVVLPAVASLRLAAR